MRKAKVFLVTTAIVPPWRESQNHSETRNDPDVADVTERH
jgi:hypothetical protein